MSNGRIITISLTIQWYTTHEHLEDYRIRSCIIGSSQSERGGFHSNSGNTRNDTSNRIQNKSSRKIRINRYSILSTLHYRLNRCNSFIDKEYEFSLIKEYHRLQESTIVNRFTKYSINTETIDRTLVVFWTRDGSVLTITCLSVLTISNTCTRRQFNNKSECDRIRTSSIGYSQSIGSQRRNNSRNTRNHSILTIKSQSSRKRRIHTHYIFSSRSHRFNRFNLFIHNKDKFSLIKEYHRSNQ